MIKKLQDDQSVEVASRQNKRRNGCRKRLHPECLGSAREVIITDISKQVGTQEGMPTSANGVEGLQEGAGVQGVQGLQERESTDTSSQSSLRTVVMRLRGRVDISIRSQRVDAEGGVKLLG
jgi:hypothetical protein